MPIDIDRLRADLDTLATFGADDAGGVTRSSYSAADRAARDWLAGRCAASGISYREDGIGNVFMRLGAPPGASVWTGSHLDSVPNGGRLDGALGVLAAVECLRVLREGGARLTRPVVAVAFADEEGAYRGYLGSKALVRDYTADELAGITDLGGRPLVDALAASGLDPAAATRTAVEPTDIHAFVELHIEQGAVLDTEGVDIGVVTDVVGVGRGTFTFHGRADHAGTTPMHLRRDAVRGAADFIAGAYEIPADVGTGAAVLTCGDVRVSPGAYGIVPERATALVDFRDADRTALERIERAAVRRAEEAAAARDLDVDYARSSLTDPLPLDAGIQALIADAAGELGLSTRRMPSGAGHDAQIIGTIARAGMIFVPSREGRSHSPREHTAWRDIEHGANVLLGVVERLATE